MTISCSRGRHYTILLFTQYNLEELVQTRILSSKDRSTGDPWRTVLQQLCLCSSQLKAWATILFRGQNKTEVHLLLFLVTVYLDLSLVGLHRWVLWLADLHTLHLQTLVLPTDMFWEAERFGVLDPPFCDCWKFVTPFSKLQSCFSCLHGIYMLMYKDKNKVK